MTTAAYDAQTVWADRTIFARLSGQISNLVGSIRRRQARLEALRRLRAVDTHTLDDLGLNRTDVNAMLAGVRRIVPH